MTFQLTDGQQEAVTMVQSFLDPGQTEHNIAVLTGPAGVGKTSLLRILAKTQLLTPTVCAPTGKAAIRVTEATDLPAKTVHRFLYRPTEDPKTGDPIFSLKSDADFGGLQGQLVIVDESSMLGRDIFADMVKVAKLTGCKFLLVGDTFQLPPVQKQGEAAFCALDTPTPFRVHMTEIVRQALDSPIIRASMLLREGAPDFMAFDLLNAVPVSRLIPFACDLRARGGVVLVHTNKLRNEVNNQMRAALGHDPNTLKAGEPLLVTKNVYPLDRFNGEVVEFNGWQHEPNHTDYVNDRYTISSMEMGFGIGLVDGRFAGLSVEEITGAAELGKIGHTAIKFASKKALRDQYDMETPPHLHANYGYALTAHRGQGSEWPEVLVVVEKSLRGMSGLERRRWLYTATTRAKTTCHFVTMD